MTTNRIEQNFDGFSVERTPNRWLVWRDDKHVGAININLLNGRPSWLWHSTNMWQYNARDFVVSNNS